MSSMFPRMNRVRIARTVLRPSTFAALISFLAPPAFAQAQDAEPAADRAAAPEGGIALDGSAGEEPNGSIEAQLRDLPELPEILRDGIAFEDDVVEAENPMPVTRLETLLELNRLGDMERFEEALPLTDQLIELTKQEFGERSIETAEALATAASVQRDAGRHELAEQNYLSAVELLRSVDGTYTPRAIDPLMGLGDNYHAWGQHLNAITAYNEARTINRRVYGLLNVDQVPILDRVTRSFEAMDQYADADEQQRTILQLAERNYEEASPEHIEAIHRYGIWLRTSGRYHEERTLYGRAMRLIRNAHGKDSVLLARPMRETANSFREQRLPDNQGISSLRSALEILQAADASSALARAEVLRDIGDWEVAFSKVEPDLETYRTAWALLGDVEGGDTLRQEWFGSLTGVLGEPISQRGLSRAPNALPGYVIVMFDVDRSGRTDDVRVARSEPPGFKDEAVVRAVRRWRFRPHVEDGEIVPRDDVALQFNYRYLPDDQAG
jgi:TonB family protein